MFYQTFWESWPANTAVSLRPSRTLAMRSSEDRRDGWIRRLWVSKWVQETLCIQITYEILKANKPVADPYLQIRGGGGGDPDPEIRGGLFSKKHVFRPFGPHFDLIIRGPGPRAPPLNPPLQTAGLTSHEKNRKTRKRLVIFKFTFQFSNVESVYSLLSFNRHLYKTDTSVKRTLRVGPCLSLLPLFDSL